jgi:[acyl-carrier-protein] S-malonyltransferase
MRVEFDRSRAAVVFPGQGSRDGGMRDLVEDWRPQLLEVLAESVDGADPFADADLSLDAEQALTVCCSLAHWYSLGRPMPRYLVGHSLGELTALAVARSISEHDAVRLAATRGRLMQQACEANPGCGMIAVRAPLFEVEAIADACGVAIAYHNAPRQVVISGSRDGLRRARTELGEKGVRCTPLPVDGAFNSPLMEPVVERFQAALDDCEVAPPQAIVYSATSCRPLIDVRAELARNVVSPVRWWETLARLAMEGVDTFIEVRAGGLLSPLPAGIVSERSARPARTRGRHQGAPDTGLLDEALRAAPEEDHSSPSIDALYAYHDEQNRLHVLV